MVTRFIIAITLLTTVVFGQSFWPLAPRPDVAGVDSPNDFLLTNAYVGENYIINSTHARYKVYSTAVTGYTTDSTYVIPTANGLFARYEIEDGVVEVDKIPRTTNATIHLQRAIDYCYNVTGNCTSVLKENNDTITNTINLPSYVRVMGTNKGLATSSDYTRSGTILYLNLADSTKAAFTNNVTVSYISNGGISDLILYPISECRSAINMKRSLYETIENVLIGNVNQTTRYYKYGIEIEYDGVFSSIFPTLRNVHIRNAKEAGIFTNSSLAKFYDCSVLLCRKGVINTLGSIYSYDSWYEDLDSMAIDFDGEYLLVSGGYTESVPKDANSLTPTFKVTKSRGVAIENLYDSGAQTTVNANQAFLYIDSTSAVSITGSILYNHGRLLTTKAVSQKVLVSGTGGGFQLPPLSWAGVADSTRVVMIGNSNLFGATYTYTNQIPQLSIPSSAGIIYLDRVNNVTIRNGTGTPEGVVTAGVGSIFYRKDGGAGTSMYIKESGTGNTGWIGK